MNPSPPNAAVQCVCVCTRVDLPSPPQWGWNSRTVRPVPAVVCNPRDSPAPRGRVCPRGRGLLDAAEHPDPTGKSSREPIEEKRWLQLSQQTSALQEQGRKVHPWCLLRSWKLPPCAVQTITEADQTEHSVFTLQNWYVILLWKNKGQDHNCSIHVLFPPLPLFLWM